jgi:hypothetical protein
MLGALWPHVTILVDVMLVLAEVAEMALGCLSAFCIGHVSFCSVILMCIVVSVALMADVLVTIVMLTEVLMPIFMLTEIMMTIVMVVIVVMILLIHTMLDMQIGRCSIMQGLYMVVLWSMVCQRLHMNITVSQIGTHLVVSVMVHSWLMMTIGPPMVRVIVAFSSKLSTDKNPLQAQ